MPRKKEKLALIIIGGLDDERMLLAPVKWLWAFWEGTYGIKVYPYYVHWRRDGEETFEDKIEGVVILVKSLKAEGYNVSLAGMSAGASAAFNVYYRCRSLVDSLINVCGRLRKGGPEIRLRTLKLAARNSKLFERSVLCCEEGLGSLTSDDLAKILTFRSCLDEIVPASTSLVAGAENRLVPFVEHTASIILAMTLMSSVMLRFIKKG